MGTGRKQKDCLPRRNKFHKALNKSSRVVTKELQPHYRPERYFHRLPLSDSFNDRRKWPWLHINPPVGNQSRRLHRLPEETEGQVREAPYSAVYGLVSRAQIQRREAVVFEAQYHAHFQRGLQPRIQPHRSSLQSSKGDLQPKKTELPCQQDWVQRRRNHQNCVQGNFE